ncbi:MAG: phosphate ABC transporter substrate-binding protein PstS [Thermoplasmata archaeon]|nr:phosphate ABC transporter substrate-binding protein PstS [Thermoplasmata archaeon]
MTSVPSLSGDFPSAIAAPPPPPPRRTSRRRLGLVLGAIVAAGLVVVVGFELGWWAPRHGLAACATGETLTGAGATFLLPLESAWAAQFLNVSGSAVDYQATDSGAGVTSLLQKTVDFAASEAPLGANERAKFPSPVLTLPVAAGGIAIVYNLPGLRTPLNLSGGDLADIYLGKVTRWNDPVLARNNSGLALPNATITAVHRSDAAGTSFVMTDFLARESLNWSHGTGVGISVLWPGDPAQVGQPSDAKLANFVHGRAYTIGYVDLTDALATPHLAYANVRNPSGEFVRPTERSIASAIASEASSISLPSASADWENVSLVDAAGPKDYPLVTLAYLYTYQSTDRGFQPSLEKSVALGQWLSWVVTAGQNDATALSYVPLPSAAVSSTQAGIGSLRFNGAAVSPCQ